MIHFSELSRNPSRNEEHDDDVIEEVENDVTKGGFDLDVKNSADKKEFRLVRLSNVDGDEDLTKTLGIFIARVREIQANGENVAAYYIAHILQEGLVWRYCWLL